MPTSPLPLSAKLHRQGQRLWRFIKSLYYASTPSWQLLKSGALFFFGFFCWAVGNLLHAFLPGVYWPNLLIVYGALLFWFGPLTHLVLVPHVIPWLRRQRQHHVLYWLGGHFTVTMLTLFFATVGLLSVNPPDFMVMDVRGRSSNTTLQATTEPAAQLPELHCERKNLQISCTLTHLPHTVTRIEVSSGPHRLLTISAQQPTFMLSESNLVEVLGAREFRVTLYDGHGQQLRAFVRTTNFF